MKCCSLSRRSSISLRYFTSFFGSSFPCFCHIGVRARTHACDICVSIYQIVNSKISKTHSPYLFDGFTFLFAVWHFFVSITISIVLYTFISRFNRQILFHSLFLSIRSRNSFYNPKQYQHTFTIAGSDQSNIYSDLIAC